MDNSSPGRGDRSYDPEYAIAVSEDLRLSAGWEYLQGWLQLVREHEVTSLLGQGTDYPTTQYHRGRIAMIDLFLSGPDTIIRQAKAFAEEAERRQGRDDLPLRRRYVDREL